MDNNLLSSFEELGDAEIMSPALREFVEHQLIKDLENYGIHIHSPRFDWSSTSIEGHRVSIMNSEVENFSNIVVYDQDKKIAMEGWMDFIEDRDQNIFMAYWDILDEHCDGKIISHKRHPGIPDHLFNTLSPDLKKRWSALRARPITNIP